MKDILHLLTKHKIIPILIVLFLFLLILSLLSEGTYGGADDNVHYSIARYAFKHPHLFLHHWGKPFFIALAAPFAQFGFNGIKLFNILAGLAATYFTWAILKHFNYKYASTVVLLIIFSPIYLTMLLSGMTEIFFSLVLILAIYLTLKEKIILSAILLSFLPFARNEGIVVFPFFIIYYLKIHRYSAIPFLFTGFLFYSIVGYFYFNDFLWVINQMPYTGAKDIYGSGEFLHFIKASKSIFGLPLSFLGFTGVFLLFLSAWKAKKAGNLFQDGSFIEMLLIFCPFFAYYLTHTILWWKGWGGSLGLTRVIAGVIPLFAYFGAKGLGYFLDLLKKVQWLKIGFGISLTIIVIIAPFKIYKFPVPNRGRENVIKKASDWAIKNGFTKKRVYYFDMYYCFYTNSDPFDPDKTWQGLNHKPSDDMMVGSVVIWDAHFGSNEWRLPLDKLMNDSLLQLLNVFRPEKPFIVLGGYFYEVCVFERLANPQNPEKNKMKYEELTKIENSMYVVDSLDFETVRTETEKFQITGATSHSGKMSCYLSSKNEYGPVLSFNTQEAEIYQGQVFEAELFYLASSAIDPKQLILAASLDHNRKLYFYKGEYAAKNNGNEAWRKLSLRFVIPEVKSGKDRLKVYLWNKQRQVVYIDDFKVKTY